MVRSVLFSIAPMISSELNPSFNRVKMVSLFIASFWAEAAKVMIANERVIMNRLMLVLIFILVI